MRPGLRLPWRRRRVEHWLEAERDQIALWLPVALGAGIAAWFALPDARAWTWFAMVTGAMGAAAMIVSVPTGARSARAAGIALVAVALGCLLAWARSSHVAAPRLARPHVASFTAEIIEATPLPARESVRLLLAPEAGAGLPPRVRVNLDADGAPSGLVAGARVSLRARLVPPPGPSLPGAYDFARVAWFQGLGATGKALEPPRLLRPGPEGNGLAALRRRLTDHIQSCLGGSRGGIAAAFVTGDTGAIVEDDSEAMRRSGLAHLLSISGLHVTAVVAAAMLLTLRLLAVSSRLALRAPLLLIAAGAGAAAGVGYTLLSGAEVPTVRSCVAALLVLGGIALGREAMTLRLVATGALVVLLFRPEALVGPSFQLSFAAVTAIVAFHEHPWVRARLQGRDEGWGWRLGRAFVGLLATGLLVEAALAPIAAFHFHRAGLYGAVANIVAIPLTTFVLMPLEAIALLLDAVGLGAPAWWLVGQGMAVLLGLAHRVAEAPGAVAALPSMPRGAFLLMLAGGLWLALWRTRIRRLGFVPVLFGAVWGLGTPAPDLLVTGDGKHVAVREGGRLFLLRARAGEYVRQQLGEGAGVQEEALELDALPGARCNRDACVAVIRRDGRAWRLLATRSADLLDREALTRACAWADVAVSDRRLPPACRPRWIKADRASLAETGGLAITLGSIMRQVRDPGDRHPWTMAEPQSCVGRCAASSLPEGSRKWKRWPPGKAKIGRVTVPPAASTADRAASRSATWMAGRIAAVRSAGSAWRPKSTSPVRVQA